MNNFITVTIIIILLSFCQKQQDNKETIFDVIKKEVIAFKEENISNSINKGSHNVYLVKLAENKTNCFMISYIQSIGLLEETRSFKYQYQYKNEVILFNIPNTEEYQFLIKELKQRNNDNLIEKKVISEELLGSINGKLICKVNNKWEYEYFKDLHFFPIDYKILGHIGHPNCEVKQLKEGELEKYFED